MRRPAILAAVLLSAYLIGLLQRCHLLSCKLISLIYLQKPEMLAPAL